MTARTLDLLVDEAELERRRAEWKPLPPRFDYGVLGKYAEARRLGRHRRRLRLSAAARRQSSALREVFGQPDLVVCGVEYDVDADVRKRRAEDVLAGARRWGPARST